MGRTTIVMADTLQEEAKELGVNVSGVCRDAVADAVQAIRVAQHFGEEFETVFAEVEDRDGDREKVQFVARLVHYDFEAEERFYITSARRVAVVDEEGLLRSADDPDRLGILHGIVHQKLSEALGEVATPRILDI